MQGGVIFTLFHEQVAGGAGGRGKVKKKGEGKGGMWRTKGGVEEEEKKRNNDEISQAK